MTGKQRIAAALSGEPADRIPVMLHHCMHAAAGAEVISNGDSPAGPDMISPALCREFALPYERNVAAHAQALGCRYILHICGNTTAILEDVVTSGADGLEIDYKTDVAAARDALRGRMTFVGNIDPSGVLARGTPDLVTRRTAALLEAFAGEPRFILNSGCAIPPTAPEENLCARLRAARRQAMNSVTITQRR